MTYLSSCVAQLPPRPTNPPTHPRPRSGRILASGRAGTFSWQLRRRWSPAVHRRWPAAFHDVTRQVLVSAPEDPERASREVGMWSLPREMLLELVARAAEPIDAWRS